MAGELESTHEQLADEMTDVQRISRRVEPDVEPDVAFGETRREHLAVGGVVNEPAGIEFGKQIHTASMLPAGSSETAHHSALSECASGAASRLPW